MTRAWRDPDRDLTEPAADRRDRVLREIGVVRFADRPGVEIDKERARRLACLICAQLEPHPLTQLDAKIGAFDEIGALRGGLGRGRASQAALVLDDRAVVVIGVGIGIPVDKPRAPRGADQRARRWREARRGRAVHLDQIPVSVARPPELEQHRERGLGDRRDRERHWSEVFLVVGLARSRLAFEPVDDTSLWLPARNKRSPELLGGEGVAIPLDRELLVRAEAAPVSLEGVVVIHLRPRPERNRDTKVELWLCEICDDGCRERSGLTARVDLRGRALDNLHPPAPVLRHRSGVRRRDRRCRHVAAVIGAVDVGDLDDVANPRKVDRSAVHVVPDLW